MPLPKPLRPREIWGLRQFNIHEISGDNAHLFVYALHHIRDELWIGGDPAHGYAWTDDLRRALKFTIDDLRCSVNLRRNSDARYYAIGRLIPLEDDDG